MASILRIQNKDGSVSFRATVRIKRGGELVLNESRSWPVVGEGARAEAKAKQLAEEWAAGLTEKVRDPEQLRQRKFKGLTVAELIAKYIEYVERDKPLGESKRSAMGVVARSRIGSLPIASIKAADLIAHCRERRAAGVKPQTINQDIIYLGVALKKARLFFGLNVDLAEFEMGRDQLWEMGLVAKSDERDRRLQAAELGAFIATAKANAHRGWIPIVDIVRFAIDTAMRQGEIVGLRWADLDEQKRTILIRDRKDPKKKLGNDQEVPLLGESFTIIQAQPRTDERIFPYHEDSVRARFERTCQLAGIRDLTFHDLRHEGISRLFEQGYEIQEVALVSGHKDWKNLKRYTQLRAEDLHRAAPVAAPAMMEDRTDRR